MSQLPKRFDDALDTALRTAMAQTPYLNILGIDKVSGTLAQLNLPPATKLTPDVARQICGKTDSKMVISQSIGDAGNGYHLQMRALECGSGATLAKEQADIGKRNEVVHEWEPQPRAFARSWESPQIRWRASINRWKRRSALRSRLCKPALKRTNSTSPAVC